MFDTEDIEKRYSAIDGVDVKYVCTSAVDGSSTSFDIFYRATPHPVFKNHYFGLRKCPFSDRVLISNADQIENVEFVMVRGTKGWEYSRHRYDFFNISGSSIAIDGGRAYFRAVGPRKLTTATFKIVGGKFVKQRDKEVGGCNH
jgi:hypothetical protein